MDATFVMSMMENYVDSIEMLQAKPISDLTTNEYNSMLAGLVNGLIDGEGLTEIQTCITDGQGEA